jgi:hypothetical protein
MLHVLKILKIDSKFNHLKYVVIGTNVMIIKILIIIKVTLIELLLLSHLLFFMI